MAAAAYSHLVIEIEQEDDGRWIGEIVELPGVLAYGSTPEEALNKTKALALRVLADRLEYGEAVPEIRQLFEGHEGGAHHANAVLAGGGATHTQG